MRLGRLHLPAAGAASLAMALSGCAALGPSSASLASARAPSPHTLALIGAPTSSTEREARLAANDDEPLNPKAVRAAFWGGVITGSVGTAMTLGFGTAGAVAANRLDDGYSEGLTYDERDKLVSRGEAYNALAITGAALMVTGLTVAAITYAIDATRCGPLRQKREGCTPQ